MSLMTRPIILFDVDKTLFDTSSFMQRSYDTLAKQLEITRDALDQIKQQYDAQLNKYSDFDPWDFLGFVEDAKGGDYDQMLTTFFDGDHFEASVFPETFSVLQQLKPKFTLGIYSEAVIKWQHKKLELSGLKKYFEEENTYIFRRKIKPESLDQLPPEAVIVDDNTREVIPTLVADQRFRPIWINRVNATSFPEVETISTLAELPALLE